MGKRTTPHAPHTPPDTRPPGETDWLGAADAAARLGVSRQTLYAYVSRGLLSAVPDPAGMRRASRYRCSEVEQLARRHAAVRRPRQVAAQTLDWGLPVLSSSLTLIAQGRLYYRGVDALVLADTATLEDTAALLWQQPLASAFGRPWPVWPAGTAAALGRCAALPPAARCAAAWALLQARPHGTTQARAGSGPACAAELAAHAGGLLRSMALACTLQLPARGARQPPPALHQHLRRAWALTAEAEALLRQALVLCADHELNASSFTARCVAATGADLGACVGAGLAALSGPRHGGMTTAVEALWQRLVAPPLPLRRLRAALQAAVVRGSQAQASQAQASPPLRQRELAGASGALLAGFGHPLYPAGDPRAAALLAALPPDPQRTRFVALVRSLTGQGPALDFALVALRRAVGAPEGAAFALFALGRTAGWIAHALEQQAQGQLIRPRAAYVGPLPALAGQPGAPDGSAPLTGRVIRRR